jgi:hypothetical protein
MKRLLFTLLLPIFCIAQPPPKVNLIKVYHVDFNKVCIALLDAGHYIEKKDNELQTVRTEYKKYEKYWNAGYQISVRIKDSTAYLTARYTAPWDQVLTRAADKRDPLWKDEECYYHTNKRGEPYLKSLAGYPFLKIITIAEHLGSDLEYIKQ